MYLELDASPQELHEFLIATKYPHPWSLESLTRCCILTSIVSPRSGVVGYIWYHWIEGADRVLDCHIAVHPDYHGRVFTRTVIAEIFVIARGSGAKTFVSRPTTPTDREYWTRIGCASHGPFIVLPLNLETLHPGIRRSVWRIEQEPQDGFS